MTSMILYLAQIFNLIINKTRVLNTGKIAYIVYNQN